jgi:hypothetical protein
VTGFTTSTNFPTVNPLQATSKVPAANSTAFVAKLNPAGSALVYSTYLGGSLMEWAFGVAVDSSGDAYVVGSTGSTDFPTANPVQATLNGSFNAFVAELNVAGSTLLYSTFLGGTGSDGGYAVAIDSSGDAYIAGNTTSSDLPTVNPLQGTNRDTQQPAPTAFLAKLSPGPAPALGFSANSLSFGGVLVNQTSAQKSVTVANLGNAPLNIAGITASADYALVTTATSCAYEGGTVTPGAKCTIDVTFSPTALGFNAGAVTITDNALGSPHTIQLTGTGSLSAANVSPTGLRFSDQLVGTTSTTQPVTVTNTGSVAMSIRSLTISSGWTESNNCLPSVAANASCTINVIFQPPVGGTYTGTLTLTDDAINSPQTVTLGGTGVGGTPSLSPTSLNFGNQPLDSGSAPRTITLTNPSGGGGGGIYVPSFTISGDFYDRPDDCLSMSNLSTDSPCQIIVFFTPTAVGTRTGTLTVTYTQPTPLTLTASLTGTGTAPEASTSATTLTFAGQALGSTSSPQGVTLSNSGNAPLTISSIAVSGDFSQTNTCGKTVSASSSCTVNVVFTPTAPGARTGALAVTDNSNMSTGSTQTVNLSGTGVGPLVSLSPTGLTFAAQIVSTQSAPQTLKLTNTGNGALTPLTITASGDFAQTNTCTGSVAAGASCTINVTFSPTDAGARTGTITLTDNASNSPETVQLSGTGMDFTMSSSATSQTVSPGQVANYSLMLNPESGYDDTVNLTCAGAPSLSTCTLTPNRATLNGTASATVAVAVSTTAGTLAPPGGRVPPPSFTGLGTMLWLCAFLGLASLAVLARARKRRAACLLGGCLLLVVLWAACGGGGGQVIHTSGTPPGTYTVDVTATDATTPALAHTLQLTLTVN